MNRPITFIRDGDTLIPFGVGMQKRFDEDWADGEYRRLVEVEERSHASHAHYFANLHEMFISLPENIKRDEDWAESEEAMRKNALIRTGFYNAVDYPCETKAEAKRWAARMQVKDDYSIVLVEGTVVRVLTAKSQSYKGMPSKGEFQRSKEAVLNYLADLIGLDKDSEKRKSA